MTEDHYTLTLTVERTRKLAGAIESVEDLVSFTLYEGQNGARAGGMFDRARMVLEDHRERIEAGTWGKIQEAS